MRGADSRSRDTVTAPVAVAVVSADHRAFFARFAAFLSLGVFDGAFLVCFLEFCAFDILSLG